MRCIQNRGGRTGGSAKREDPFAPHSADPFARTNPSTAQVDPFADLLHLSFSRVPDQASGTASATRDVAAFARYSVCLVYLSPLLCRIRIIPEVHRWRSG